MSSQPFSSIQTTTPQPFTTEATEEHREKFMSLLDEPWKIKILPEPPALPPGVLPAPDPHEAKSLPWRRGDVTRLKDDSPKGMMEYIATHTNGWWQELAERALRDTEKAERMAREAGWQPGQCWALEVDAEAKQKLLEAEDAKRKREEAERAKEAAEKEAFMQRQMELLKKAGRAPRCEYLYTDGRGCRAPQVKGERWCHGHAKAMSYRPEKLEMELMEDEQAVMVNLYRVTKSLLAGRISEKTAGLMLWSVAIGAPGAKKSREIARDRATSKKQSPKSLKHRVSRGSVIQEPQTSVSPCLRGEKRSSNHKGAQSRGNEWFRENSLNRHGQYQHSRGPSTPPYSPSTGSGSLGVGRDDSGKASDVDAADKGHFSVSPCLRGEKDLCGKASSPIRVHPRQSAVGCSSSAPPCLRGENNLRTTKPTEDEEEQRGGGGESPRPA